MAGQESISISPGECIATFIDSSTNEIIACGGDTFCAEQELLGAITPKNDRAIREMSADGSRDVVIQDMTRAGEREVTFLQGDNFDKLVSWAQRRIQPIFTFEFYYKYDKQSSEGARIQRHKRCFFKAIPMPVITRDQGYAKATVSFGDVAMVNPSTGTEI